MSITSGSANTIRIEPVTRLEGHGNVSIFLDDLGHVAGARLQVPELRGFEKFCEGRPVEDMPQLTSRICGVCPTAHHMASTKALDALYGVEPPRAARKIREFVYSAFVAEDHALHLYYLGGPDFFVGPTAPPAERNVLGVIARVGREVGLKVIEMRRRLREAIATAGGKVIHPVLGVPGGVARAIRPEEQRQFMQLAADAVEFAQFTLETFDRLVLHNSAYLDLIRSDAFTHRTYYMGMVDEANRVNFYDGCIRVVRPDGAEYARFDTAQYARFVSERTEPWSYMKSCYLEPIGWKGFVEGAESGIYSVAPLARLNAADGMATPLAQSAFEQLFSRLGGKPVHHTLANHWARAIELLYAAERMRELAADPELIDPHIRVLPEAAPREGIGAVEAPRGTLIHHYLTDERGIVRKVNLVVATQHNAARIAMSLEKAAKSVIEAAGTDEATLNGVEMALRAYDPCLGCATHFQPYAPAVQLRRRDGSLLATLRRRSNGGVERLEECFP
jgi:F420-non-reducing hydrogenase large subunit